MCRSWIGWSSVLLGLVSPLLFAHEDTVLRDHRKAILDRVAASCPAQLCETDTPRSRSANARETDPFTSIPEKARRSSDVFSYFIAAELDLPYADGKTKSHVFFRKDPYEGEKKLRILEQLGISFQLAEAPSLGPTWMDLARNYKNDLKRLRIESPDSFLPNLILYRSEDGNYQFRPADPFAEESGFPLEMADWKVLDKDVLFNIPFLSIFETMQAGGFPLLNALHDVSHFVAFLRFPDFAKALRHRFATLRFEDITPGFKAREYWLTEALSLPDPGARLANIEFLSQRNRPTEIRPIAAIEQELAALPPKTLIDYSYALARYLESQLRDVSGGNSNAAEKWYYLGKSFQMDPMELLEENLSNSNPAAKALELGRIYFENGPVTLQANKKTLSNETATFNFNTFAMGQKLLALSLAQGKELGVPPEKALQVLAKFASRVEFLLVGEPFAYHEWVEGFLQAKLPKSSSLGTLLADFFGNEVITRYYLGSGEFRAKKTAPKKD